MCFVVIINNDANVLEYTEQFEVALLQNDTAIHFPPQQRSINVTIVEDPHDGMSLEMMSVTGLSIMYTNIKSKSCQKGFLKLLNNQQ